jgi:prepilin-type N-terminal cleavage/methylation domain-containing protein
MKTNESGFTYIELAVSLAISSILMLSGISILGPLVMEAKETRATIEAAQIQTATDIDRILAGG